jgi:hypothetical protein
MINTVTNVGPFAYCSIYQFPHTSITYFNDGDGHYHQAVYIVDGEAEVEVRDSDDESTKPAYIQGNDSAGSLIDETASRGKYVKTITKDVGLMMVTFNPIPSTRELDIEIVKGSKTREITTVDNRITVVCLTGTVTINDKELVNLQYAKILPGKTVTLTLPKNSICALVQDK